MTIAELQALYAEVFAEWVRELELEVRAADGDTVTLALPVRARHVHAGGVVCGQTLMAAADTALVLAISHRLGGFRPQTTVQLQTSFLRAVGQDVAEVAVQARILKAGRSLVFGEVTVRLPDGQVAAHATSTSALL
ncbi:MAG TPA: PaaI family thioesterase [Burkholderiaceae bacterium]